MSNISDIWSSRSHENASVIILPDGCRDLIIKAQDNQPAKWFISPLFDHSEQVATQKNTTSIGFRFKAGTHIAVDKLTTYLQPGKFSQNDPTHLSDMLNHVTELNHSVDEALACLGSDIHSVSQAASLLGVSTRSLQRLLIKETQRSPSYWFQLARVRQAARCLTLGTPLIEAANQYGFSDQAHMCREFQRWFKTSPSQLIKQPALLHQLTATGYGFD